MSRTSVVVESMGAHLYKYNDKSYWDESLRRLRQNVTDIFSVLEISLKDLEAKEMEAFLDICCFLIGEEEGTACSVLESCYGLGGTYLEVLKNRCLITISEHQSFDPFERILPRSRRIEVHDQIRDMGRRIVREEKGDRAWDEETAENILKDEKARSTVRGLSISSDFSFPKEATKCRSLPHLKILVVKQVEDRELIRDEGIWGMFRTKNFLEKVRCKELRWLKWRRAPFRDVPLGICPKSLRVLDLAWSQIERVPNIGSLTNLQRLDLSGCSKLKRFDSSIGKLKDLRYLNLESCRHVELLKEEIEGLQSLELLTLENCKSLRTLTSLATTLRTLHLMRCESLESLKASSSLPNLQDLRLLDCDNLKELDCEGLQSLELLNLFNCKSLRTLSSLATTLRTLRLDRCESLESLKASSSSLPNLRDLTLWRCDKLKELDCEGCHSLERLELEECDGLESLEMPSLPNLRHLKLFMCRLKEVDCGGCRSLEHLELKECYGLESLEMPSLPNLRRLKLYACYGLKEVDCGGLPSLQTLYVFACGSLKRISVLPRSLERLGVEKCNELQVLDGLDTLTNLRGVTIEGCPCIAEESLPENIKRLPRLPWRWFKEE
ncbi:hypothetical protein KP509_17G032900 [Ceratopteris richardii]|uniref:Uncharacterized protein n=1 Tax=Ceratopteris richardii TaxID=49495 RepID=A0A8T2SVA5_CERRI|nr:hypothetical protein KP509_17G032900 [Ceratopteris richardii]